MLGRFRPGERFGGRSRWGVYTIDELLDVEGDDVLTLLVGDIAGEIADRCIELDEEED